MFHFKTESFKQIIFKAEFINSIIESIYEIHRPDKVLTANNDTETNFPDVHYRFCFLYLNYKNCK